MRWFSGRQCYWDILFCSHTSLQPLGIRQRGRQPAALELEGGTVSQHMTRWFWYTTTSCRHRLRGMGKQLFPTNFNPFMQPYATYDAVLWKEKWDTQQQEQAPLAAHSLCLDTHTPTDMHTYTHTHSKTIECSPTLTHETEQLATKKTKKNHLHYRTLVDSQVLEPTLSLECSPLTNASFQGEKLLSCAPPISPVSVQTPLEPVAEAAAPAVRCHSRQT